VVASMVCGMGASATGLIGRSFMERRSFSSAPFGAGANSHACPHDFRRGLHSFAALRLDSRVFRQHDDLSG